MENWYTDLTLPIRCGISNDIKNMKCKTVVVTIITAQQLYLLLFLLRRNRRKNTIWLRWVGWETQTEKKDWSYSISYQHYRQDHLYHYHHIMLKIKEQKMMIISSFIIKSNGSRLRKKERKIIIILTTIVSWSSAGNRHSHIKYVPIF